MIYRLTLNVSDGDLTDTDDVDINVTVPNVPPNADAGADIVVQLGPPAGTATLDGTGSNDPDNGPATPLTFQWTFVSAAPGSALTDADIQNANTDTPSFTPDVAGMYTLQLRVFDGEDEDFDQVMVTANAAPVAVDDAFNVDEDTPLPVPAPGVLTNDTDANNDPLTSVLNTGPTNAQSFTLNPDGSFDYTPNANFTGDDTFTYHANDGSADSNVATVTITVNEANDPPVAVDDTYTTNEDGGALAGTSVLANDTDEENDTLTAVLDTGPINAQSFTLNPDGTFSYTPNADFFGTDTFTYHANDGNSDSNVATVTITVNEVNDAPSFTAGPNQTVLEDAGAQTVNPWATAISPGPGESGQTLSFLVSNDNNGLFVAEPAVASNGVLTFTPAPNAFGSANVMVTLQDDGGTTNGGVDTSGSQGFTITVLAVNDPPVATAKAHQTHSGIRITIGAGDTGKLKDGATDVDDPFGDLAVSASFGTITPAGATITLTDAATGTFTYNPPAGFSGPASFTFQVCDDGIPTPPQMCSAATTVSFNVTGPDLWFVQQGASGTGRLTDPFGSLASLPGGRGNGDRIFVFTGTYGTGHALNGSEHLIGQGSSGTFDTVLGVQVPGNGTLDTRPSLGGARPQLGGTVTLNTNGIVRGLNISSATATGLTDPVAAIAGVTVSEVSVTSTTGTAVNLSSTGGTVSLTSVSASGAANGIVLNNTTGSFTVAGTGGSCSIATPTCTGGTIQNATGHGINLNNVVNVVLNSMRITGSADSGINGTTVNGFVLNNALITANGNDAATDDSGVELVDLTGSASGGANPTSITNTTISNNFEFELQITNATGTLTDLQMSGNTISSNTALAGHGNLFNFLGAGGGSANMTLNLTSGTFTGNAPFTATGVQCDHSGTSGTMTCNISGTTFTNNNVGPQGSVAGNANVIVDFNGNNIQGSRSHAVNIFADANAPFTKTITGRIRNNIVGTLGTAGSGSSLGFPIRVQNEGRIPMTLAITGNTVQESTSFTGINVNVGITTVAGSAATNATITGNTVREIDSGRAIAVQQNDHLPAGGNAGTVCTDIGSNTFSNVAGQAGDGTQIRVRRSDNSATAVFNVRQAAPTAPPLPPS